MFAVDAHATVTLVSADASALLPALRIGAALSECTAPSWLVEAHLAGDAAAHGSIGGSPVTARCAPLGDGHRGWWFTDVSGQHAAEHALLSERQRTAFLADASDRLLASLNLQKCVRTTAELAATHLADAAVVIGTPLGRRLPVTSALFGRPAEPERLLDVTTDEVPGLAEAMAGFPPVPSRWIDPAQAPGWLLPEGLGRPGAMAVVPLPGSGLPAGALILLRAAECSGFGEDEERFARIFAARAGAAISAAAVFAEQSRVAALLQHDLLPPELPRLEAADLASAYRPAMASQRIGGDFYEVFPATAPGQETTLVLGDVCGKGLEAAVLTGRIRTILNALRLVETDHAGLLRLLNTALVSDGSTRFATLVLASIRERGHGLALRLTAAGHPAPLIVRADGTVEAAATRGTLVGVLPEVRSSSFATSLEPGETCLLFSDGVTEARGGPDGRTLFGEQRLRRALAGCSGLPAAAVVERVHLLVSEWLAGRDHDDIAIVAVTARPRTHLGNAVGGQRPGGYMS